MKLFNLVIFLVSFFASLLSSYAQQGLAEKVIFHVRPAYLAEFVASVADGGDQNWQVGQLRVPTDHYKIGHQETTASILWEVGDQQLNSEIVFDNGMGSDNPSEWMRNPAYTPDFKGLVAGRVDNGKVVASTLCPLPLAGVLAQDLSHISSNSEGYETLEENLNACLLTEYGHSMAGWLGIRGESLSGRVLYALLKRTKKEYRPSAFALLASKESKVTKEQMEILLQIVVSESDDEMAMAMVKGALAVRFCSSWNQTRLCDVAINRLAVGFKERLREKEVFQYLNAK